MSGNDVHDAEQPPDEIWRRDMDRRARSGLCSQQTCGELAAYGNVFPMED
jgi:hypothetical protein